jgi:Ca2+-binding EF-hand superfamily protein
MGCGSARPKEAQPKLQTEDTKTLTVKIEKKNIKLTDKEKRDQAACAKFKEIDKDNSGYISFEEMMSYLKGKAEKKGKPLPSPLKLQELVAKYDKDKNGMLSRDEFEPFLYDCTKASREAKVVLYAQKKAAELQKKKKVTPKKSPKVEELGAFLRNSPMFDVVLKEEMKLADKDRSGALDIDEFLSLCKKISVKYECAPLERDEVQLILTDIGLKGILGLCPEDVNFAAHAILLTTQLIYAEPPKPT